VLTLPEWITDILLRQMTVLEAEDMEKAIMAASAPYMEEHDRRRLLRRLQSLSRPPAERQPPVQVIEEDPDKAREWFERIGARVERSG